MTPLKGLKGQGLVEATEHPYPPLTTACADLRVFTPTLLLLLETFGGAALNTGLLSSISGVSVFISSSSEASGLAGSSVSVLLLSEGCSRLLFLFSKFSNMCMMASTFLSSRD